MPSLEPVSRTETPGDASLAIKHNERYHNNDGYVLPSDDEESKRLTFQHEILREAFDDRIVLAPLELAPGAEVLDIGTGNGIWAQDFIATYPNANHAKVLCIDIGSRLFPSSPPPNTTFQVCDFFAQDPASWSNRFAFVHQRLLNGAIKQSLWPDIAKKIYTITAPGGWAQLLEPNVLSHFKGYGPATARMLEVFKAMGDAFGLDHFITLKLGDLMREAGFVDVQVILRETPLGPSYGETGIKWAQNVMGVFRGFKSPVLRMGGFGIVSDEKDYDNLMNEVEAEWASPGQVAGWYIAVGRKA